MDTGYLIVIDTNCINARQKDIALNELEQLADGGNITVETTDALLNELDRKGSYPQGKDKARKYIFSMGAFVFGQSKLEMSIVGSKEDDDRLGNLLNIFFGHKRRQNYSNREMGDVRQIATAIKYGANFFVTRDRVLLNNSNEIKNKFEITIADPEECVNAVRNRLAILSPI